MSLTDKINLSPPAGTINGVTLGTTRALPFTPPFGSPVAKNLAVDLPPGPRSVKPNGFKGHVKPTVGSVKPKSTKSTKSAKKKRNYQ